MFGKGRGDAAGGGHHTSFGSHCREDTVAKATFYSLSKHITGDFNTSIT